MSPVFLRYFVCIIALTPAMLSAPILPKPEEAKAQIQATGDLSFAEKPHEDSIVIITTSDAPLFPELNKPHVEGIVISPDLQNVIFVGYDENGEPVRFTK